MIRDIELRQGRRGDIIRFYNDVYIPVGTASPIALKRKRERESRTRAATGERLGTEHRMLLPAGVPQTLKNYILQFQRHHEQLMAAQKVRLPPPHSPFTPPGCFIAPPPSCSPCLTTWPLPAGQVQSVEAATALATGNSVAAPSSPLPTNRSAGLPPESPMISPIPITSPMRSPTRINSSNVFLTTASPNRPQVRTHPIPHQPTPPPPDMTL